MISNHFQRRGFLLGFSMAAAAFTGSSMRGEGSSPAGWSPEELISPAELVSLLKAPGNHPKIICVTFPFLYRQKHIPHAKFAGPAAKPQGIADLRASVEGLPKNTPLVVYCGCCPMDKCPNVRPAYETLKGLGFGNVRVLSLPTNFHTDWVAKGYAVETASAPEVPAPKS